MPKENMIYDFRNKDICWSNTPYNEDALKEIPSIEMVGYQQDASSTKASIDRWYERILAFGTLDNPYKGLYQGTKDYTYILPFLNEYHHNISQSWATNDGPLGPKVKGATQTVERIAKVFLPSAGIIYPKSYAGGVCDTYTFTFNLINTNTGGGLETETNIEKNTAFLEQFIRSNLHRMNGSLSISPPLIYEILIPGVRWCPAAVVSGLAVNNKGTMNKNIGHRYSERNEEYVFPDAWEVTVQITELMKESENIFEGASQGGSAKNIRVRVFK